MGRIQVNMGVEASSGDFCHVKPGTYRMRIESSEDRVTGENAKDGAGKPYIAWRLSHVTPKDQLLGPDGRPLEGVPAGVFYNTRTDNDKQSQLRALVEAALGEWRDFDAEELYGKEIDVSLKYQPENPALGHKARNDVARVVKTK